MMTKTLNRRSRERSRSIRRAWYSNYSGECRRSELLNKSDEGARITTGLEVKVGDRLFILDEGGTELILDREVIVRWVQVLPGGCRQVVGVQATRTLRRGQSRRAA